MEISESNENGVHVVALAGRLDGESAPQANARFAELIESGETNLVLDVSELEFISSIGLRSVVMVAKNAEKAGGKLAICGLHGSIEKVFELSGLTKFLSIHESRDAAVAELAAG